MLGIYSDNAVLVVKPGMTAVGKTQIRKAFEAIAEYFNHKLTVRQAGLKIVESEDTALVLAKMVVSTPDQPPIERNATYAFKKDSQGNWLCVIDNSYGHELFSDVD